MQAVSWQKTFLSGLQEADTADRAFHALEVAVRALGFEFHAYVLRVAVPITRSNGLAWSTFPAEWQALCQDRGYVDKDPIIKYGQQCTRPMVWPGLNAPQDASFWRDASACGLRYGWSQTIRDHRGVIGTFSLARRDVAITPRELEQTEPQLIWLVQLAHAAISNRIVASVLPSGIARLSANEKQILHWTAEGKTAAEVAAILDLTERNVGFHMQNAINKLDASNKTHASVKAALLGLIPVR